MRGKDHQPLAHRDGQKIIEFSKYLCERSNKTIAHSKQLQKDFKALARLHPRLLKAA